MRTCYALLLGGLFGTALAVPHSFPIQKEDSQKSTLFKTSSVSTLSAQIPGKTSPGGGQGPTPTPKSGDSKPTPTPKSGDSKPTPQPKPAPQPSNPKPSPVPSNPKPNPTPPAIGGSNPTPKPVPSSRGGTSPITTPRIGSHNQSLRVPSFINPSDFVLPTNALEEYLRKTRRLENGPAFSPRNLPTPIESNNNFSMQSRNFSIGLPQIPKAAQLPGKREETPEGAGSRGTLEHQVRRMEDYRTGLRSGYYHYDRRWRDCHFGFRFYFFTPSPFRCVFSPYYYYWCVPGYIGIYRVYYHQPIIIILLPGYVDWYYCGLGYLYAPYYYSSYSYRPPARITILDRTLSDIVDAFKFTNPTLLSKYLPREERVNIYLEGEYAYSMSTDDYYDITADLIYSVYTTDFRIVSVRRGEGNYYRVVARHDFIDPSNRRQTVWMTFTLQEQRGNMIIVEAGTSSSPITL